MCVCVRAAYYLKDLTKKGNVIQMVQRQRQQKRNTIANKYVKEEEEREKCHQKYSHNLHTQFAYEINFPLYLFNLNASQCFFFVFDFFSQLPKREYNNL